MEKAEEDGIRKEKGKTIEKGRKREGKGKDGEWLVLQSCKGRARGR